MQYTLRHHPRSRHLRLAVYPDGRVIVTAPKFAPTMLIERFVQQKSVWITGMLDTFAKRPISPHKIKSSRADYKKYKDTALKIATEKVEKFNAHYKFKVNNITIKNQKTRWGSCSSKGNINLNYKIALIPEELVDYIVVHELCHLGQFNHSKKFWDLVGEMMPEYVLRRRELRGY
jgi:predicted metal-dependent hydrolase